MPRTNSEFFVWFNDEQDEPLKLNLIPTNTNVSNAMMPRTNSEMHIWNADTSAYPQSNASSRRNSTVDMASLDIGEQSLEDELALAKQMARSNSREYFIWNTDENGDEKPRTIAIISAQDLDAANNMGSRVSSRNSMANSQGSKGNNMNSMPRSNSE
jgi:hypothetical protein